ncbi:hypothetical protein Acj9p054 [Acinetobacter phage Acj9]|uniref:Uncharacterized protein n=1 Tax=Acinetobacter phage Acj9 TaxID=760939 RepID=E5EPI8_9CAUD|nr:hypothetical protein Acj9p054 [Acinetobacter phage Acj9]ADG59954.1 hypothetical protein Acj9p054 [Acinetobacter phage Acj9]
MNAIARIELILENCESIVVERGNLVKFDLYGYATNLGINGKWSSCAGFVIAVDGYSIVNSCINSDGCMLERLQKYKDITSIKVQFDDNTIEEVFPIWPEDDESGGQIHEKQAVEFIRGTYHYIAVISQDMGLLSQGVTKDLQYAIDDAKQSIAFVE